MTVIVTKVAQNEARKGEGVGIAHSRWLNQPAAALSSCTAPTQNTQSTQQQQQTKMRTRQKAKPTEEWIPIQDGDGLMRRGLEEYRIELEGFW